MFDRKLTPANNQFSSVQNPAHRYPIDSVSTVKNEMEVEMLGMTEVNKERQLSKALKNSERRYALTVQTIHDGVWEWDLVSDRVKYSPRWKSMVGLKEWEIEHSIVEWLVRVNPADSERLKQNLTACRQGKIDGFEIEYSLLHKDRQYRSMRCKCIAVKNARGKTIGLIGSQTDITEQKQTKARLNYHSQRDRLTDLPNRQVFIDKLQELSELQPRSDFLFGILCLDLDRFKNVNYNFGHSIGDRSICEIARKLQSCLQPQDILARLGGDEFAILLVGFGDRDYPSTVASQIQQVFSEPIKVAEHSIFITLSIGIANPPASDDLDSNINSQNNLIQALENAETAMHRAKEKEQGCNVVFESRIYLQNLEKTRSADDLIKALEQEQFELNYQPIVRLEDRQLVGFEALIRWQHPLWGLIYPADFITLAENTGTIVPIGWWVLRSACLQTVRWQQKFGIESIFVSVNITGKQFSQPYAGDIISQILAETGLNPHCLKLEITESEIIENIDLLLATVNKLRCLGVQLSMDDFGTGYSSLSYLHCLPIDTLKIDRCFIQRMERDRHQIELVKTIVKLAEVFNLDLIAEGIETKLQLSQLVDLKCKYGQGYLFSPPVPPAIAASLIARNTSLNF